MDSNGKAVVIHNCSNGEDYIWLSEAAERRLCRIMTGVMALLAATFVAAVLLM